MPERAQDWLKQARYDLDHAQRDLAGGDFEWACFAAQQAAEKAVKALYQSAGGDARGHSLLVLLQSLPPPFAADSVLVESARRLDKHYIPARYPNAYPAGVPHEYYTREDADRAVNDARQILQFCERHLA